MANLYQALFMLRCADLFNATIIILITRTVPPR